MILISWKFKGGGGGTVNKVLEIQNGSIKVEKHRFIETKVKIY